MMIGQAYLSGTNNILLIHTSKSYIDWWTSKGAQGFYYEDTPRSIYHGYKKLGTIAVGLV